MVKNWTVDKLIIVTTTLCVLAEITINFITSYGHISILGLLYGEKGLDADLTPIGIDFTLFAFAMLNLFLARKGRYVVKVKKDGTSKQRPEFRWPRWVLGGGVSATVAANLAYGFHWGVTGALIAAFSAAALFFTVEGGMLLMRVAAEEAAKAKPEPVDLSKTINQRRAEAGLGPVPDSIVPVSGTLTPEMEAELRERLEKITGSPGPMARPIPPEPIPENALRPEPRTWEYRIGGLPAASEAAPAAEPEGKPSAPQPAPQAWGGLSGIGLNNGRK